MAMSTAKTSILSHVIIMQTTKPHRAVSRNPGARTTKTDPGLKTPEEEFQRVNECVIQLMCQYRHGIV